MKINLPGLLRCGTLTSLLVALLSATPTRAAVITYAMNDPDPHWRTTSVSKPLDIDGDATRCCRVRSP